MTRYGNYGDMFIKLLKDSEDETWDVYFVFEKDSPPDNVLANYEARLQFHLHCQHCDWPSGLGPAGPCTDTQCSNTNNAPLQLWLL